MNRLLIAAAFAALSIPAIAQSADPTSAPVRSEPYPIQEAEGVMEVVKVDKTRKLVTVKDASGGKMKVHVPAEVSSLDQIKPGSILELKYVPGFAVSAAKPGSSSWAAEQNVRLAPRGGAPSELNAKAKRMTGSIVDFDRANSIITVRGSDGMNIPLTLPENFTAWDDIKAGEQIMVQYTEPVALTVGRREAEGASGPRDFERTSTPSMPADRTDTDTRRPGSDPMFQQRNEPSQAPNMNTTPANQQPSQTPNTPR